MLGVHIHNLSRDELLARLDQGVCFTPNVDFIMRMRADREFHRIFHQADFRICDSRIVQLAARFLGTPIREKISGSDFFGEYCAHHRDNPQVRVFLLGAMPGVAEEAARRINARLGCRIVVDTCSPPLGFDDDEAQCTAIVEQVNRSGATTLAVGVGAPRQEKWIMRHRHRMPGVRVFMGIGATIDFEAGNIPRAPRWMQSAGLEWAYRLLREPRRLWRRYLVEDMPFLWLILLARLRSARSTQDPG